MPKRSLEKSLKRDFPLALSSTPCQRIMSHMYWWLVRVTERGFDGRTCSRKPAKVPDQCAARCCWVKATRLLTKSPWRSVSSERFDILALRAEMLSPAVFKQRTRCVHPPRTATDFR